jgi:hypothetical protein
MSDIKRFFAWPGSSLTPHDDGLWVRHDDHLAEVERLRSMSTADHLAALGLERAHIEAVLTGVVDDPLGYVSGLRQLRAVLARLDAEG